MFNQRQVKTMKKTYITPSMETIKIASPNLMSVSNGSGLGDSYNSSDVSYSRGSDDDWDWDD